MKAPDVATAASSAAQAAQSGKTVWVHGPEGSGRETVTAVLREQHGCTALQPPPLDEHDSAASIVLLLASALGVNTPFDAKGYPSRLLVDALLNNRSPIVIRVAGSIVRRATPKDDVDDKVRRDRLRRVLRTLLRAPRFIWVADDSLRPQELGVEPELHAIALPAFTTSIRADDWGSLAAYASIVAAMSADPRMPIVWRLAIGAVSIDAPRSDVAAALSRPASSALADLTRVISLQLTKRPEVAAALSRVLSIRTELSAETLIRAAALPSDLQPFFLQCVGYGDSSAVRVNPTVRRLFELTRRWWERRNGPPVHTKLAKEYEQLDGASSPLQLPPTKARHWIEKIYHMVRGDDSVRQELAAQDLSAPEIYWDYARSLSRERRFPEAAEIYRKCISAFPESDYANHYLAFNLAKSDEGKSRDHQAEIVASFNRAVELAPENPWWNSRRISYLIQTSSFSEAKRAWNRALQTMDPDGSRVASDPWFVANFHYWVARAWLDASFWYEAQNVVRAAPDAVIADLEHGDRRELKTLKRNIDVARERDWENFEKWVQENLDEDAAERARSFLRRIKWSHAQPVPALSEVDGDLVFTWSHPERLVSVQVASDEVLVAIKDRLSTTRARSLRVPIDEVSRESTNLDNVL